MAGVELHPWLSMKGFFSSSIIFSRTKIVRYTHAYAAEDRAPLGSDPSAAAGLTGAAFANGCRSSFPFCWWPKAINPCRLTRQRLIFQTTVRAPAQDWPLSRRSTTIHSCWRGFVIQRGDNFSSGAGGPLTVRPDVGRVRRRRPSHGRAGPFPNESRSHPSSMWIASSLWYSSLYLHRSLH